MKLVTLALVVVTMWAYGLELFNGGDAVCAANGFVAARPSVGTALSSMFLHDPSGLAHLGLNMVTLMIFGTLVERAIGSIRFAVLYFAAGFMGAIFHLVVDPSATVPMVGASGAIFGVMAAAAMIRTWALAFTVIYFAFNLVGLFAPDLVGMHGIAIGVHVGGFIAGFLLMRVSFVKKVEEVEA